MAGFGSGPWGGTPWGGFTTEAEEAQVLVEGITIVEDLQVNSPFRLVSAETLSPTSVRVLFGSSLGVAPANFEPSSYVIDQGLSVLSVSFNPTLPQEVVLTTSPQSALVYTLQVSTAIEDMNGDTIHPFFRTTTFQGYFQGFVAVAQSSVKVRLTFPTEMDVNAAFLNPSNYTVTKIDGTPVPVAEVSAVGVDGKRAQLILGAELDPQGYYTVSLDSSIVTKEGDPVDPSKAPFQWKAHFPSPIRVPFRLFSGEVEGTLLGTPAGQVFFSPALEEAVAGSVLQVDSVKSCTRAYDVYKIPEIPDPAVLYTFPAPSSVSAGHVFGANGAVLFAPAPRLGLARIQVKDLREDIFSPAQELGAHLELREPIDITRASFLNDARWRTFPGVGAELGVFRTADNLTPIGPGPTISNDLIP